MPYKDRGKWRAVVRVGGKRLSASFETKREARAWEEAAKKESTTSKPLGLYEVSAAYLKHVDNTLQPKTGVLKRRVIKSFLAYIESDAAIATIGAAVVHGYLERQAETRSKIAANDDRASLLSFWNFAQRLYDIPTNPVRKVPPYPIERRPQYTPPEVDVMAVLAVAVGEERVWLLSYLLTGAREQEVNRLTWADVDFTGKRICLWSRKNARHVLEPQWVPLAETLANALRQWRQHTPYEDNPLVLPSPKTGKEAQSRRRLLRNLCKRAGVRYFPFHAMRRYVGSILVKHGEPLRHVQLILRHSSLAHTERYIQGLAIDLSKTAANLDAFTTGATTPLKIVK